MVPLGPADTPERCSFGRPQRGRKAGRRLSEVHQEALCRESDALSAAMSERFTSIIG